MVTDPVDVWASTSLARFCSIYLFLRDLKFTAFWARIKVAMIAGLIFIFVKLYPALPDIVQKKVRVVFYQNVKLEILDKSDVRFSFKS